MNRGFMKNRMSWIMERITKKTYRQLVGNQNLHQILLFCVILGRYSSVNAST